MENDPTIRQNLKFVAKLMRDPSISESDYRQLESILDSLCALRLYDEMAKMEPDIRRHYSRCLN